MDTHACPAVSITGADGVGMVMMGSPTVLINYMMACRMGDIVVEIPGLALGPANPIVMGCPTVIIGEVGMGTPGPATMGTMGSVLGGASATTAQSLAQASQAGAGLVPVGSDALLGQAIGSSSGQGAAAASDQKKVWIEIKLVDQDGSSVPNEPYTIELPDGTVSAGSTDGEGVARVDGIDPGNCTVKFPSLDQRSWTRK